MREIKFRAWDKKIQQFIDAKEIVINDGKVFRNWQDFEDYEPDDGTIELVWFTGLEDKNGTEIFEGDIVEQSFTEIGSTDGLFDNPPDDIASFTGEIKMSEGAWWIDSGSWAIPLFSELNPNESIGNRFENPELLKAIR